MAAPFPRPGAPAPPISVPHDPAFTNVGSAERVASALGGGLLAGLLAYRGLSGHCPVFARLGISTAEEGAQESSEAM